MPTRNKKSNVPLILAALAVAAGGFWYVKRKRDKERVQALLEDAEFRRRAAQAGLGAAGLLD